MKLFDTSVLVEQIRKGVFRERSIIDNNFNRGFKRGSLGEEGEG